MVNRTYRFNELTRESIRKLAPKALVVIPVAAVEQHGSHLPVGTDSMIIEYLASQTAQRITDQDVIIAPTLSYGSSHHHILFPGTMSLRGETLLAVLCDLGDSLVKSGFHRLFFLNGHGGNASITRQAVMELSYRHDSIIVGAAGYWDIAKEAIERESANFGISAALGAHAGLSETSMVLAIREHLVDGEAIKSYEKKDFSEHPAIRFSSLKKQAYIRRSRYMLGQDGLSESPVKASRELGEKLNDIVINELVCFFKKLVHHP